MPPKTEHPKHGRVRRQLELPLNHPHEQLPFGNVAEDERLLAEYQVLGFAASGHPLSLVRDAMPPHVVRSDQFDEIPHEASVEVAGIVVARQRPQTARGFTFILLEDEFGMMNAIVRPKIYERDRVVIRGEPFLWVIGKLARDDGTVNIIAEEVRALKLRSIGESASMKTAFNRWKEMENKSPYAFLKRLRGNAPGSKDWG